MSFEIHHGDALTVLRTMPDASVHCAICSPPYWSLRDYGTAQWRGGLPDCDHVQRHGLQGETGQRADRSYTGQIPYKGLCGKCGARRVDQQLGLESLHDCLGWAAGAKCGECYICHMVEVFRELRRVLREDGTLWVNEGDSYAAGGNGGNPVYDGKAPHGHFQGVRPNRGDFAGKVKKAPNGLKPKDLCGMPWRLALALQADGWYWRDAIVWAKPAPMPESVRDRCTKAWEPILMFAKSERYYFDQEAIREPQAERTLTAYGHSGKRPPAAVKQQNSPNGLARDAMAMESALVPGGRNKRNVWRLPPMPVSDAHFATFPLELPETCLMAATSERGVCPKCGAPWKRQVRKSGGTTGKGWHDHSNDLEAGNSQQVGRFSANGYERDYRVESLGWQPSCKCGPEPVPATVLDCFAGSGTTGLAALKHGRNFIGIELSEKYIEIARKRLGEKMPLLSTMAAT